MGKKADRIFSEGHDYTLNESTLQDSRQIITALNENLRLEAHV